MATGINVRPFRIAVSDADLDDLKARLAQTRWPNALVDDWSDGTDLSYMRELVAYWADEFDWRARESHLNTYPQFTASVDGCEIHFLHVRGNGPRPMPLVITHGWPGSFVEMLELIPRLTDPERFGGTAHDAFDVVVPSLPGYGFSQRPAQPGTTPKKIAETWAALMTGLGYERFGAQGGDWGSAVSTHLGMDHSERAIGVHLNYAMVGYLPSEKALGNEADADERAYFESAKKWTAEEGGYAHLHATKPQTPAYALTDSPAGLAAYIVEKFRTWSDCGGDIERAISRDAMLTNIALYWFTQTIGSSVHLYWERLRSPVSPPVSPPPVPFALAAFPKELTTPPRRLLERSFHIERYTKMPRGGHFAALEQPELLANDIVAFFRDLRTR